MILGVLLLLLLLLHVSAGLGYGMRTIEATFRQITRYSATDIPNLTMFIDNGVISNDTDTLLRNDMTAVSSILRHLANVSSSDVIM